MSKNFELLLQLEKDFVSAPSEGDPGQARPSVVVPSFADLDVPEADHELAGLVQRLFIPTDGVAQRQVVFCGVEPGNASSSVCARTAKSLATRTRETVCVVDANPFKAGLTGLFGKAPIVDDESGSSEQCLLIGDNLWLARTRATDCKGSERSARQLRTRLAELQHQVGYILIDAPGCAADNVATELGLLSDSLILVIEAETTHRLAARKAKQRLEAAGVRIAGAVLHNRSFPIPQALYERL